MFFYLLERAKEYIQNKYSVQAVSTLAYLILYSYVPKDLKFYFWALFTVDVTITYYKKIIFDKIDEWYGDKIIEKDVPLKSPSSTRTKARQDEEKTHRGFSASCHRQDEDIKTNKSGYFESALDEQDSHKNSKFYRREKKELDNSSSTSTELLIDKMIKDSKSF